MNERVQLVSGLIVVILIMIGTVVLIIIWHEPEEVREIPEINETISINAKCSGTAYAKENCLLIIENQYKIIKLLEENNEN